METVYSCPEPECRQLFHSIISLSVHYRKRHEKTAKTLYMALHTNGKPQSCKCGCGEETRFLDITRGFSVYKVGHNSRVSNNYQTDGSAESSLATRRAMLEAGEWKPFVCNNTGQRWSKGKTKITDERIKRAVEKLSPKEIRRRSEAMKQAWKSGRIQPLVGAQHPKWKGGVSGLVTSCHANKKLYEEWKYPLLAAAGFACSVCGVNKGPFEVHHDKERMSDIVHNIAIAHGWNDYYALTPSKDSYELKVAIVEAVATYHIDNHVSGIVLCERCHKTEHAGYNLKVEDG